MKVFLNTAAFVATLLCVVVSQAKAEPDYNLPSRQPPTSPTIVLTHGGNKPLQPPTLLHPVSSTRSSQRPRGTKIVEHYISSEFSLFGGGHPLPPPPPKHHHHYYRLPHPNAIPRGPPPKPFEVVRAPVIYHQTVTDTDVTQALADAFDVVEKLRKPGNNIKALRQQEDTLSTLTNVEFVNHALPQNSVGNTATTTTTIVEAPQHFHSSQQQQTNNAHHLHQSQAVTLGQVTLVSNHPVDQQGQQHLPPIPAAADVAPPAHQPGSVTVYATSAPVVAEIVPVLPATTTSTSPAPASPPKLIIPSQRHVTTLGEAVQSVNPQVRTIIQPVYIPYPVDQHGNPFGPLPDYHSMDFGALLSAQKHILTAAPSTSHQRDSSAPIQIVQTQPAEASEAASQQPHHQQQQYYIQTDQSVAAADVSSSGTAPSPSPKRARKRIARRRNNSARRI